MKTQITKQHTNVVAVQPLATFRKEDRMKKQGSTTLKLAFVFAMVVTMALSAVAQEQVVGGPGSTYYNPLQVALKFWGAANQVIDFITFYDSAGTLHTPSQPNDMAFDGEHIWMSNRGNNTVMKIRASDGQFQASYPVTSPGSLAFDGQRIWVNQYGGSTVSVIFASDGKPVFSETVGDTAKAMSWDGWTMWEATNTTIGRLNSWGAGYYCVVHTPASGNTGVAFDGNYTWVSNSTGYVYKYDWTCALRQTVTVSGGPAGIVFDGTNMWTANASGTVARITPGGSVTHYPVGVSPQQVAFDGANIWVTLGSGGTVAKVLASGTVSATIAPCSSAPVPVGLAFDGASMWVTCPSTNAAGKM